ncbi:MAG: LysM peptidoglycan-binding domain-containing M23 family metallopeptidase [Chloroflexi bacterium]|nr:LysM peptidoglycan-binding domain-containing M23 family metallopeptidase [Chloroflexota bacterium]
MHIRRRILSLLVPILLVFACNLPETTLPTLATLPVNGASTAFRSGTPTVTPFRPPARGPNDPILTPTPDAIHVLPSLRGEQEEYYVQLNDTLGGIAALYGVPAETLIETNDLTNPDILSIGQMLLIPPPVPGAPGSAFKIIPDSELVNGPVNAIFNIEDFVNSYPGYLSGYLEEIDGELFSGAQIVARIATHYSISPRLLLVILEHNSGWLTIPQPPVETISFPMGNLDPLWEGLYSQLAWAADNLNRGYYLWRVNATGFWLSADGTVIPIDPTINAGTAGVQHMMALIYDEAAWRQAVGPQGLFATYNEMFGYSFDWAVEPILPPDLSQPVFQLPFETGVAWVFTGGPHGGWDNGSAWAALDFAPPGEQLGCVQSDAWVVAVADGLIVRSKNGAIVQDLDGDGKEQTGWTVLYMHIESREQVEVGQFVRAGERIGHPSCEGGIASGTHLHLARRYNGEWIPADGQILFEMDGWYSVGSGILYDGYMVRGDRSVEACECREPDNMLQR